MSKIEKYDSVMNKSTLFSFTTNPKIMCSCFDVLAKKTYNLINQHKEVNETI